MKPDRRGKASAASGTARHARAPQRVRIIGGRFKRTPLPVADAPGLRPTPDRVRETLFNWLAHLRPDPVALRGLDAFAGTGALGFELASRGAARVLMIERAAPLAAQLRAMRDKLGADGVDVRHGDALVLLRDLAARGERFDLVFLDPPFGAGLHAPALAAALPLLAPHGLVYVESDAAQDVLAASHGLLPVRALKAGQVHAQLFARAADRPAHGDDPPDGASDTHLPPPADH